MLFSVLQPFLLSPAPVRQVFTFLEFPEAHSFFLPSPTARQQVPRCLKSFHWQLCLPAVKDQHRLPALDSDMQPAQGAYLLEEAKDECVEPHGVVGELCVLADLAIEAVQQLGRGACGEKQNTEISCGQQNQNGTTDQSIRAKPCLYVHCPSTKHEDELTPS